jgi:transcriptional regulator with XRE-family HTH domain
MLHFWEKMMHSTSLTTKQQIAVRLLAQGESKSNVAARLDVSRITLSRWEKNPQFESQLTSITRSGLEQTAKMLNAASLTAAETLQEILCDMTQPVTIRLKAALGVLHVTPAISLSLQRDLYQVSDFDLKHRGGTQYTYNSQGEIIDRATPSGINQRIGTTVHV